MLIDFDPKKSLLRATFTGNEVSALVNYLKPFRNNAPVGEWLRILEPLCAPIVEGPHVCRFRTIEEGREGCSCGVVREINVEVGDEADEQEEMQAEAIRQLGGRLEDEDTEEVRMLPQVAGHTPEELDVTCKNCGLPRWRHMVGSDRCQVNGQSLGTFFRPPLMLEPVPKWLAEASETDGAVFARTVGDDEVKCG